MRPLLRALGGAVTALTLALAVAAPAHAAFAPRTFPCAADSSITGFAASGADWLAVCVSQLDSRTLQLSRDSGTTWNAVAWGAAGGRPVAGVSVGPDGAFYLGVVLGSTPTPGRFGRIARVDPAAGTLALRAETIPAPNADARLSPPFFDAAGKLWVAYSDGEFAGARLTLARLDASGTPDVTATTDAVVSLGDRLNLEVLQSGADMYVRGGRNTYKRGGTTLTRTQYGAPVWRSGTTQVHSAGVSLDGGATFVADRGADAVEGSTSLLFDAGWVLARRGPMFSATGLRAPTGATRVIQTTAGLVGVADTYAGDVGRYMSDEPRVLALHAGAVPPAPFSTGPLTPTATAMLVRANQYRAQAGLPPLVGDPKISQAGDNHSRYWTLNPAPAADHILDYHSETAGRPGYTGASVSQRCAAVGAACGSEILSLGAGNGVDSWVASIYHRFLLMDPRALVVGGGQAPGGPAVMNGGEHAGVLLAPVMFPYGAYDGPLSFAGEAPDPTAACAEQGDRVDWPLGTAISAWAPGVDDDGSGSLTAITVTPVGGTPMRGCELDDTFLPDDPLKPGTTYSASAIWHPGYQLAPRTLSWTFTTAGEAADEGDRCRPRLARVGRRVRRGRAIRVRYRACGRARLTVGVYRGKHRRARRSARVRGGGTLRVSTKRLRPGRYTLRARLAGRTLRATVVVLARPLKT